MLYIPVLKNRTVEMSVLRQVFNSNISTNIIPIIEIIQEKTRTNNKLNFTQEIIEYQQKCGRRMFIDICRLSPKGSTAESSLKFLTAVNRDHNFVLENLKMFLNYKEIIPIASYNINSFNKDNFIKEIEILHDLFSIIGIKIYSQNFNNAFPVAEKFLFKEDYLIFDIRTANHSNPLLNTYYKQINNLDTTTIILNDPRSETITNKGLVHGEPIIEIDNSLLTNYQKYNFNGFGDYAGIASSLPSSGGTISPAGIYYSKANNFFVGYKGRKPELSEFNFIAKCIIESEYWNEFSKEHHDNCPGCINIMNTLQNKNNTGCNQAVWKGITMSHYIYSVDESL